MTARIAAVAVLAGLLLAGCGSTVAPPPPDGVGYGAVAANVTLSALACEPLAWCVAAGSNPTASTHAASIEVSAGGRGRWAPAATPAITGATLTTAACWGSGCLVGGAGPTGSLLLLVDPAHKAAALTASHPPGDGISALACTGPGRCLAFVATPTATAVFETTDSGASWQERTSLPATVPVATSAACANAADCVVAGTGPAGALVARSTDGGARWVTSAVPRGLESLNSLTCSSARFCLATARRRDGQSALLESTDGGRVFVAATTVVDAPAAVTCQSMPTCVIGGGTATGAIATGVRTGHEQLLTLAYVPDPVIAVACATPVKCTAITALSTVSFVG